VEAGRRIGKYVLDERIAVGGMAEVWAARAEGREGFVKPVALKFILESFSGDPELERLFVNEARIAARLQHANLVTVFDFDKVGADEERGIAGRHYIAMERVEGQDLRRILEAARRAGYVFPVGVALYVAGEVLKALRYVHEKRDAGVALGLVHRDVSPHNVLVGYGGEVKLSDFGIAKAREHSARGTKPGVLRGKIAYASPEQLAGGAIDHRTDQFAAGVTIWEMLAGRRLFEGGSDLEIIGKVARCEVPPLGGLGGRRDVPAAVEGVVRRMLAADPGARHRTTAEALSAVLGLPSYSPDGATLGELVRALFTSSGVGLSQTVPLSLGEGARAAAAPTRTMDDAPPLASASPAKAADDVTRTPTRVAKRTTEALARSPAAAPADRSTTSDVRSGRAAARVVGALVLGAAVVAAVLARREPSLGAPPRAATPPTALSPAAALEPASATRSPSPPPAASAPLAAAHAAAAPSATPPITPAAPARRAARGDATEPHRTARRAAVAARASSTPVAAPMRAIDAPVVTPPARAPDPPPSAKSSANGAPIIE
jgi:serine/threonine-protein kinase